MRIRRDVAHPDRPRPKLRSTVKRAKNIPAESVLKIGSLDIAKKAADDWLRTRGKRGEGGAKVVDLYDQRTVYEVALNADGELVEVPTLPFADRPRPKRR